MSGVYGWWEGGRVFVTLVQYFLLSNGRSIKWPMLSSKLEMHLGQVPGL